MTLLPEVPGRVLEIGSGGGFLADALPDAITSDIMPLPGIDLTLDARHLPFASDSLRAIAMVNVLHHIPDAAAFFAEAERCLVPGGAVIAVEPWVTPWSRLVYTRLHHEPFDPDREGWTFPDAGPLSAANGALPWIALARDAEAFHKRFPGLRVERIQPIMPMSYLFSGGVSMRSLLPAWAYGPVRGMERLVESRLGIFAVLKIVRTHEDRVRKEDPAKLALE